jgi:hypothetical protein
LGRWWGEPEKLQVCWYSVSLVALTAGVIASISMLQINGKRLIIGIAGMKHLLKLPIYLPIHHLNLLVGVK